MAADVHVRSDPAGPSSDDDDAFPTHLEEKIVARVWDATFVIDEQPLTFTKPTHIPIELVQVTVVAL